MCSRPELPAFFVPFIPVNQLAMQRYQENDNTPQRSRREEDNQVFLCVGSASHILASKAMKIVGHRGIAMHMASGIQQTQLNHDKFEICPPFVLSTSHALHLQIIIAFCGMCYSFPAELLCITIVPCLIRDKLPIMSAIYLPVRPSSCA